MKIFRFVKKIFLIGRTIVSDFTNANSLNCFSMKNQECKIRPQILNPIFYPSSIKISKCSGMIHSSSKWSIYKNLCSWYFKKFKC